MTDLGVNLPRPGAHLFPTRQNLLECSSGPKAYDWASWVPDYSREADPFAEPWTCIIGDYPGGLPRGLGVGIGMVQPQDVRVIRGLDSMPSGYVTTGGPVELAFHTGGIPQVNLKLTQDGFPPELVSACHEASRIRTMHLGCPMLDWRKGEPESRIERSAWPSVHGWSYRQQVELAVAAGVPVTFTATVGDVAGSSEALIEACEGAEAVEVGNEYPWNSIFPESMKGRERAHGGPLPTIPENAPHDHSARRIHGDAYRQAAVQHGALCSAFTVEVEAAGRPFEVTCGGWAGAGQGLLLLSAQSSGWSSIPPHRYTVGGYVGSGNPTATVLAQGGSVEQLRDALIVEIGTLEEEWRAIRTELPDGVAFDCYEQGVHAPGAGGGDIPRRTWELFRELNEGDLAADIREELFKASQRVGMDRVFAFELPVPARSYEQDPRGTTLFRLGPKFGQWNAGGRRVVEFAPAGAQTKSPTGGGSGGGVSPKGPSAPTGPAKPIGPQTRAEAVEGRPWLHNLLDSGAELFDPFNAALARELRAEAEQMRVEGWE